jgi:two-component system OmpR family response regulator
MHVLIIEDEAHIADSISNFLTEHGIHTTKVAESVLAEYELRHHSFDIIILDLGLANVDGIHLLKRIRLNYTIPILILTARDNIQSKLDSFKFGADDYMTKPFSLQELLARIHALLRRSNVNFNATTTEIKLGKIRLNQEERQIYAGLEALELSVREYGVLSLLLQKKTKVVSKRQLQEYLSKEHGEDWVTEAAIEVYIHRVRKKIEQQNVEIVTVRGFGYILRIVDN